jgi:hypothetical protein
MREMSAIGFRLLRLVFMCAVCATLFVLAIEVIAFVVPSTNLAKTTSALGERAVERTSDAAASWRSWFQHAVIFGR